jgi:stalled ribosome rescue protein Dom34
MPSSIRSLQPGQEGAISITTNSSTNYKLLGSLIEPGDQLITKIRIKVAGRSNKKQIAFIEACVIVEHVVCEDATVQVRGLYRSTDNTLSGRTSVWLTDGCTFALMKRCWSEQAIQALRKRNATPTAPENTPVAEGKVIAQFRDLIATDPDYLAFGESVFYAADYGTVRALICTDRALAKQPRERENALVQCGGKFRGANVFILKKDSEFYHEIQNYGGIVGILAYRFNPEDCLT